MEIFLHFGLIAATSSCAHHAQPTPASELPLATFQGRLRGSHNCTSVVPELRTKSGLVEATWQEKIYRNQLSKGEVASAALLTYKSSTSNPKPYLPWAIPPAPHDVHCYSQQHRSQLAGQKPSRPTIINTSPCVYVYYCLVRCAQKRRTGIVCSNHCSHPDGLGLSDQLQSVQNISTDWWS